MDWNIWHWLGLTSRKDIHDIVVLIKAENVKRQELMENEIAAFRLERERLMKDLSAYASEIATREKELMFRAESNMQRAVQEFEKFQKNVVKRIEDEYAGQKIVLAALSEGLTKKYEEYIADLRRTRDLISEHSNTLVKELKRGVSEIAAQNHKDIEAGRKGLEKELNGGLQELSRTHTQSLSNVDSQIKAVEKRLTDGLQELSKLQKQSTEEYSRLARDLVGVVDTIGERIKDETKTTERCLSKVTTTSQHVSEVLSGEMRSFCKQFEMFVADCRTIVLSIADQSKLTAEQMNLIIMQFDKMQESLRYYMVNAVIDSLSLGNNASPKDAYSWKDRH